jgi:hypothetical protein
VTVLISDEINFRARTITKEKEGYFIMTTVDFLPQTHAASCVYTHNYRASK